MSSAYCNTMHKPLKKSCIFSLVTNIFNSRTPRLCCFNVKHSSDLTPYRTLWFAGEVVIFQLCEKIVRKCISYPFSCDMGLDGTLTSHIELVCDSFDMACQSAI